MPVTASLKTTFTIAESLSIGPTSPSILEVPLITTQSYVAGAVATSDGINAWWTKAGTLAVTLAAGASVTYTLTSLTDALARATTFVSGIKCLYIKVTSRTAGDYLTVGQAATNPWTALFVGTTPGIKVYKFFAIGTDLTDKYAVTAASNEQLKITNSGSNSITFEIGIVGCSS